MPSVRKMSIFSSLSVIYSLGLMSPYTQKSAGIVARGEACCCYDSDLLLNTPLQKKKASISIPRVLLAGKMQMNEGHLNSQELRREENVFGKCGLTQEGARCYTSIPHLFKIPETGF